MEPSFSVLLLDMFRYQDPEAGERRVEGFPTLDLAVEYARRRVRDSVEELRQPGQTRQELREAWYMYGEDAVVSDGDYAGSHQLDLFIRHPAQPEERDWRSLQEQTGARVRVYEAVAA